MCALLLLHARVCRMSQACLSGNRVLLCSSSPCRRGCGGRVVVSTHLLYRCVHKGCVHQMLLLPPHAVGRHDFVQLTLECCCDLHCRIAVMHGQHDGAHGVLQARKDHNTQMVQRQTDAVGVRQS